MVVISEVLVQGQQCICCRNVNSHGDADAKAAEKIDQNHLMQGLWREKLDRWIDTRWMTWRRQHNTVRRVCGLETCVVGQTCCFAGGSNLVCVTVVVVVDVGAVGGSEVAIGGSDVEADVAGSTSIRAVGGGSGALNTSFGGFFKASKHF
uniref:Uncharacterized protein n=1 Tax=Romanomermis culicivorax TaxID=13658 RepID=A0A915KUW6_ROMCU